MSVLQKSAKVHGADTCIHTYAQSASITADISTQTSIIYTHTHTHTHTYMQAANMAADTARKAAEHHLHS